MNIKVILYFLIAPIVIFSLNSINISKIFKKNKTVAAWMFYIILIISITYIITCFIYEFINFI